MIERRYLVAALGLHVVIFALMFASAFFHHKIVAPAPIEAVLVSADAIPAQAPTVAPAKEEQHKQPVEETKPPEPPKPVEPPKPPPKPELTEAQKLEKQKQKEALEEQKRQAETARKEKEAEIKAEAERKKQEEQQKKAEAEQKRQEELKKKQEEAEQKRLEEQRRKEIAAEQERIKREAEAAEAARRKAAMDAAMAAEQQGRIQAAQADWGQVMAARIRKFWIRPPASPDAFHCVVAMKLSSDGQVLDAQVTSSCGSAPLDRSVRDAVIKASPMPLPKDPGAFVPDISITFCPSVGGCQ